MDFHMRHVYDINVMGRLAGSLDERCDACRCVPVCSRASLQNEDLHLAHAFLISTADTSLTDARVSTAPSASLPMFS